MVLGYGGFLACARRSLVLVELDVLLAWMTHLFVELCALLAWMIHLLVALSVLLAWMMLVSSTSL